MKEEIDFLEKVYRITMHNFFETINPNKNIKQGCTYSIREDDGSIYFRLRIGEVLIKSNIACRNLVALSFSGEKENILGEHFNIHMWGQRDGDEMTDLFHTEKLLSGEKYRYLFGQAPTYELPSRLQDEQLEHEYIVKMYEPPSDSNNYKVNKVFYFDENLKAMSDRTFKKEIEERYDELRPYFEQIDLVPIP